MYQLSNTISLQCVLCFVVSLLGSNLRAEKLSHIINSTDINPSDYVESILKVKDTIETLELIHKEINEKYYDNLDQANLLAITALELAKDFQDPDLVIESHIVYNNTIVDNMDEYFINSLVQLSSFNEAEILTDEQIFTFYKSYSYYLLRNGGKSQAHNTCTKYLAFVKESQQERYAAQVYYRLGQQYALYNNKNLCYDYFDKSVELSAKTNQSHYVKLAIINKALYAADIKDLQMVKECLQKIRDQDIINSESKLLFRIYLQIIQFRIAILQNEESSLMESIEEKIKSVGSSTIHCQYYKAKGEYYKSHDEPKLAYNTYIEALEEMKPFDQINYKILFAQKLRDCSLTMNNLESAFTFSKLENELRDSIDKKNINYKLANLQKLDISSTNKIIRLKKEKSKFQEKAIKRSKQILYIVTFSFLSFLIFSYYINKRRTSLLTKLKNQNEELSDYFESNSELKQFTAIVSHDFKSPLRTISNFSALLRKKLGNKLNSSEEEYFDRIESNSKKLSRLIDGLMSLNKLDESGLDKEPVGARSVLEDVIQNLSYQISNTKANIVMPKVDINLYANQLLITQLLQNIISNAIKFSSKNQTPAIEIELNETDKDHIIEVRDNGIGIEKDFKNKLFKSFEKYHAQSEYEGSGLGLSICKKIIDKHNGDIGIKSNEPKGLVVWFSIPRI